MSQCAIVWGVQNTNISNNNYIERNCKWMRLYQQWKYKEEKGPEKKEYCKENTIKNKIKVEFHCNYEWS